MLRISYSRRRAERLLPLLDAIALEIAERRRALRRLERARAAARRTSARANHRESLVADIAVHRRELRHALEEVRRLGCTVVGLDPPTFRIRLWKRSAPSMLHQVPG
jgi:hypothetical protein